MASKKQINIPVSEEEKKLVEIAVIKLSSEKNKLHTYKSTLIFLCEEFISNRSQQYYANNNP